MSEILISVHTSMTQQLSSMICYSKMVKNQHVLHIEQNRSNLHHSVPMQKRSRNSSVDHQ